jgi:hypothetical protein
MLGLKLYPGAKVRHWKTLCLDPDLGIYAVTAAKPLHRLVLLPRKDGPMEYVDHTGTIRISREDKKESEPYLLIFKDGILTKGPTLEA